MEIESCSLSYSRRTGHEPVNPVGAVATPLRYRKTDCSRHSQRTEHEPKSRVDAVVEPSRCRSDGHKLNSRRYARVSLICAATGFRRYRQIDRGEYNGSSYCQRFHTSVNSIFQKYLDILIIGSGELWLYTVAQ
jgi:hypothetical protein